MVNARRPAPRPKPMPRPRPIPHHHHNHHHHHHNHCCDNDIAEAVATLVGIATLATLIADLIFAFTTKQKFRTIFLFAYMPVLATMLYIVLAGSGLITWLAGWPIIFVGLAVDFIIALTIAASNAKYFMYKQEDDE